MMLRVEPASCFIPHHDGPLLSAVVFDMSQETGFVKLQPLGEFDRLGCHCGGRPECG